MSTETAVEETEEGKQLPPCGRVVFRGVELAYLNIDGEYMLPLAELLALVLPSTPRTTLFTRMEKMKVRRHFCQPEEIKLLKTVNGIHGSSANCTLLSKSEVERYCAMFIDKPSEFNKTSSSGDASAEQEQIANEEDINSECSPVKDKEKKVSSQLNNNAIPSKLEALDKHRKSSPVKAVVRLTKVAKAKKLKSRSSPDCQVNKTLTDNTSRVAIDGDLTSVNVNKNEGDCIIGSLPCAQQVTNCTQTKSFVNIGTNMKRIEKRNSSAEPSKKMRKVSRGKKRSSDDLDIKEVNGSPLKIPKRSKFINGHEESDKGNKTSQFHSRCTDSKNQDNDTLINSDSSSIDSGFASTALSNASSPTKTEFSAVELSGLLRNGEERTRSSPPSTLKLLKTPKKNKIKSDQGKSLTLSPPALLLKRFEDSWLVEEKSPVNEATNCLNKRKVKPEKKARSAGLAPLFDEVCVPAENLFEQKQAKKQKKCRKPLSVKEEIESKTLNTKDLSVGESQDGNLKKKKFKRKQKGKLLKQKTAEQTSCNGQVVGSKQKHDFSTAKENKPERLPQKESSPKSQLGSDKQTKEELVKKDLILERLVGNALAKFFGPTNSTSQPASTNVTPTKVVKPKVKKRNLAPKPVLKTNSNFKLLNLFPATSPLTLQDGVLGPSFTMSCPKGNEPDSSHPLWGWSLGRPIFRGPQKSFKSPKPVEKELLPKPKLVTNKVKKLRRRRKRLMTDKKAPSTVSDGVNSNVTIAESKQSVPVANAEFKLPSCSPATNIIALSSTTVEVS